MLFFITFHIAFGNLCFSLFFETFQTLGYFNRKGPYSPSQSTVLCREGPERRPEALQEVVMGPLRHQETDSRAQLLLPCCTASPKAES